MARTTVDFDFFDDWMVVVHTAAAPLRAEWDQYIAAAGARVTRLKGMLVYSEGGAPDAAQRDQGKHLAQSNPTNRIAVMTNSTAVRMVILLLSFLNVTTRGFSLTDLESALEFLRVPKADRAGVSAMLETVKARLASASRAA